MHTNRIDTSGKSIGEVDAGNCPASVLSELLCCPFCGSQPGPLASGLMAPWFAILVGPEDQPIM